MVLMYVGIKSGANTSSEVPDRSDGSAADLLAPPYARTAAGADDGCRAAGGRG